MFAIFREKAPCRTAPARRAVSNAPQIAAHHFPESQFHPFQEHPFHLLLNAEHRPGKLQQNAPEPLVTQSLEFLLIRTQRQLNGLTALSRDQRSLIRSGKRNT